MNEVVDIIKIKLGNNLVPSMPPDDLRCAALASTSLQVSWQPPPVNHQNGLLQGYKVSFEPMADDNTNGKIELFLALAI